MKRLNEMLKEAKTELKNHYEKDLELGHELSYLFNIFTFTEKCEIIAQVFDYDGAGYLLRDLTMSKIDKEWDCKTSMLFNDCRIID